MTKTATQILLETADDLVEYANCVLRDAPHMGPTKERKYRLEAAEIMKRSVALRAMAEEPQDEPVEKPVALAPCPVCSAKWQLQMWHDQYCDYRPPESELGHCGGGLPVKSGGARG